MSYSIIRVVKVKSKTNTRGIQRENKNYENIDIDLSKSYLNYDLVNDTKFDFNKKIDEKIEKNYKGKRKIRTDAIKHIDGLITSDNVFLINYLKKRENSFLSMLKRSWKKNTVKKIFYMRQYIWMR